MKRAGDFATRIAVWVLTIVSGLMLLMAREFVDDHRQLGTRLGMLEREVSGLHIQVDVLTHSKARGRDTP